MGILERYADTYEILGKLGEGGGGIVYKAYHKRLHKEVVVKKIKMVSMSEAYNRQEVDILKNLNHTFLPQVFDFLMSEDEVYTVMSYIPGKSFQQLMKEGYTFTQNQLIKWGVQLLGAVNYLHSQNPPIIHSDIKPANIMLTPEGNICLIDFNISFFLDGNTVLGYSNGYSSPEQYIMVLDKQSGRSIGRYSTIDEKSDIYSVGATLYYLATGKKKVNYKVPIDTTPMDGRFSEAFIQVIEKSMQTNPEERYSSALEMLQALQTVYQKDSRYQNLLKRQKATRIGLVALMAGSIALTGYGVHEMQLERVEKYNKLVEQQIEYRENDELEKSEEMHEEAKKLDPGALESYYQHAYGLYQEEQYEECISFIDYDILENEKIDKEQQRMADVYYVKAESHYQQEAYENAVDAYEMVMHYGTEEPLYYRDYAIALAYAGDISLAENVLQEAIDHGLEEDSIYFAKGEINKALRDWNSALNDFAKCILRTENDKLKARAYALCSDVLEQQDERGKERALLSKAIQDVKPEYQMLLLEKLIQVNIDLADITGESEYREDAIATLKIVMERGWETYKTYDNLVILFQKQGNLSSVEKVLNRMIELYGEDYNVYKRFAFLEIEKQERLDNYDRNYYQFAQYYETAKNLYEEKKKNNVTDMEMDLLENTYRQVAAGGWL